MWRMKWCIPDPVRALCILWVGLFPFLSLAEWDWQVLDVIPPSEDGKGQPGLAGAYAGIHNDCLIIAGGANFPGGPPWAGGKKIYHQSIYALERVDEGYIWHSQSIKLPTPLAYGTTVSTEHGLICMGGESPNAEGKANPVNTVFVMQWDAEKKQVIVSDRLIGEKDTPEEILPFPKLSLPTANLASVMYNDRIFLIGGNTPGGYNGEMWYLDVNRRVRARGTNPNEPIRLIWRSLPMFRNPERSHCLAVVQNDGVHDCIWVLSGRRRDRSSSWQMLTDLHKYNLQSRTWLRMSDIRVAGENARCVMAGTTIADGFDAILVLGGANGVLFKKLEEDIPLRIAAAEAAGDVQHATDIAKSKTALLEGHPGFSPQILRYSALLDSWEVDGAFPRGLPVTSTLLSWGDDLVLVSGEIRPGVRTPVIWKGRRTE